MGSKGKTYILLENNHCQIWYQSDINNCGDSAAKDVLYYLENIKEKIPEGGKRTNK